MQSSRFLKLAKRFGFKIRPIYCRINDKYSRRPDILAVTRKGMWELTIPKKMYSLSNSSYRDLAGIIHPDYWQCETNLYRRKYAK